MDEPRVEEYDRLHAKPQERLAWHPAKIDPPMTFTWPSGTVWEPRSIYMHDTLSPNGTPPTADARRAVAEAMRLLGDDPALRRVAGARMLMFSDRKHCVGGAFEVTRTGRYISLYARYSTDHLTLHLLAKLY